MPASPERAGNPLPGPLAGTPEGPPGGGPGGTAEGPLPAPLLPPRVEVGGVAPLAGYGETAGYACVCFK